MGKRGRQYIKTRDSDSGDDKLKESLISWDTELMILFDKRGLVINGEVWK